MVKINEINRDKSPEERYDKRQLSIDNLATEHILKNLAIRRLNWLFANEYRKKCKLRSSMIS